MEGKEKKVKKYTFVPLPVNASITGQIADPYGRRLLLSGNILSSDRYLADIKPTKRSAKLGDYDWSKMEIDLKANVSRTVTEYVTLMEKNGVQAKELIEELKKKEPKLQSIIEQPWAKLRELEEKNRELREIEQQMAARGQDAGNPETGIPIDKYQGIVPALEDVAPLSEWYKAHGVVYAGEYNPQFGISRSVEFKKFQLNRAKSFEPARAYSIPDEIAVIGPETTQPVSDPTSPIAYTTTNGTETVLWAPIGHGAFATIGPNHWNLMQRMIGKDNNWYFVPYRSENFLVHMGSEGYRDAFIKVERAYGKIPSGVKALSQTEGQADVAFSRNEKVGASSMSKTALEQYAGRLLEQGENIPKLVVVEKASDLPFDAPKDARGAFHEGTIYLVSEKIALPEDAKEVILHEFVGHFGLRGFFGDALNDALLVIHANNPLVRKYAAKWRTANAELQKQNGGKLDERGYYYRSIEEAMAKMAQEGKPFTAAKRLITKLQALLRAIGMNRLADLLEAKTNAEALEMLNKAKLFITQGRTASDSSYGALYPAFLSAWHGTPHMFAPEKGFPHGRFRLDKIGTGEGAQAYGHGVYFAEEKDVADQYTKIIDPAKTVLFDGKLDNALYNSLGGYRQSVLRRLVWEGKDAALMEAEGTRTRFASATGKESLKIAMQMDAMMRDIKNDKITVAPRTTSLYNLDLPNDVIPKLLDWDRKITDSKTWARILTQLRSENLPHIWHDSGIGVIHGLYGNEIGSKLYSSLTKTLGSPKAASGFLSRAGIPGLKYLDQGSRNRGPWIVVLETGKRLEYGSEEASKTAYEREISEGRKAEYIEPPKATSNFVIWDQPTLDRIALLERNGERLDSIREEETQAFSRDSVQPWPKDFPKAFAHTTVSKVLQHPDFDNAKKGDVVAAGRLVNDLLKTDRIKDLAAQYPDAIVVPVHEIEDDGAVNMIPLAMARALGKEGLRVDEDIFQITKIKRKGLNAVQRLLARKEFSGPVERGAKYILVDDILTQGGTVHELRHHIANQGGDVAGVFSLAFSAGSNIIAIKDETIREITERFGRDRIERLLQEHNISGTVEALTESEGRAILRFKALDALRDRISEENRQGSTQEAPRDLLNSPSFTPEQNSPDHPAFSREEETPAIGSASLFPEVNERLQAARGIKYASLKDRAKDALVTGWEHVTRHFPYLSPEADGAVIDVLRKFQDVPAWAKDESVRRLSEFIGKLSSDERFVFTMNIILPDMIRDIENGTQAAVNEDGLPFGYKNREQVRQDYDHFKAVADASPAIKAALEKRNDFMASLTDQLIKHKLLKKEAANDPSAYFHHQVLAYMNYKENPNWGMSSRDVRTHRKGWQIGRKGSQLDYNTEYIESEFEIISQALTQIETVKSLKEIERLADIKPELEAEAKDQNMATFYKKTDTGNPLDDPLKPYRTKIAIGFQRLTKLFTTENSLYVPMEFDDVVEHIIDQEEQRRAAKEDDIEFDPVPHPRMFAMLNYLINHGDPGAMPAAMIFKAIAERNTFIKQVVGKDWVTYRDLIPEGYVAHKPEAKSTFYFTNSVADQALEQVLAGNKNLPDAVRQVLARGRDEEWVIKEGISKTLNEFRPAMTDSLPAAMSKGMLTTWKQWILMNPFRVVKYNLNNMSGDLDIAMAYDPKIITGYFMQAFKDLWAVSRGNASEGVLNELSALTKRGVIGSGMTAMDIPELGNVKAVKDLVDFFDGRSKNALSRWYSMNKRLSTLRENILRLAAARYFADRLQKGEVVYGASRKAELDAIASQSDKAAKLARELIGDYGNISHAGQYIRERMIPFYSWMEINAPRYVRLFRNLKHEEGNSGYASMAGVVAWKATKLGLKASALMAMVMLWNAAVFPDEEDELQETGREQLHLILGRRADGSIITLRFQGALSDALSWFGMSNPVEQFRKVSAGTKSPADMAKDAVFAPFLKGFQGFRPEPKLLYETLSGQSFFPDPTHPRPIRDTTEHILRTFSLDRLYNRVSGKPKQGGTWESQLLRDIGSLAIYEADPGEQAYYTSRKYIFDWLDEQGKERPMALPTNKSNALYYYKQALKYGDFAAAERYLKKYHDLGGKLHGVQGSIRRVHPLASLKLADRFKFKSSLSPEQQRTLAIATAWYKKHYVDTYHEQRERGM